MEEIFIADAQVTIAFKRNGPYIVKGPIKLIDTDGSELQVEKEVIALCRWGASSNKPFCDGTHTAKDW
jgi:CDGSH-type Zn-finger protein